MILNYHRSSRGVIAESSITARLAVKPQWHGPARVMVTPRLNSV